MFDLSLYGNKKNRHKRTVVMVLTSLAEKCQTPELRYESRCELFATHEVYIVPDASANFDKMHIGNGTELSAGGLLY
jgi:hypothetical protein